MSDQSTVSRRRMLALSATGIGLSLAGCAGQSEDRSVTVSLQPSQEDLQPAQAEARAIQRQQLTGNLTQQEAQRQLAQIRSNLFDGLIDTATEEAESLGLTVDDTIEPDTMLVSGPEPDILDLLDLEIVAGITDADAFEQQKQQQQQQQQPPATSSGDGTDDTADENESTN